MPERAAHNVVPRLRRVFVTSILGGGLGRLGYFVALTILAWIMLPEVFGSFSALYLSIQALTGILGSSALIAVARVAAKNSTSTVPTRRELRVPVYFGVAGGAVGALVIPWAYRLLTGSETDVLTVIVGFACLFSISCEGILGFYAGRKRYRLVSSAEAIRGLCVLSLVLVTAGWGPQAVVLGIQFGEGVIAVALFLRAPRAARAQGSHSDFVGAAMRIAGFGIVATFATQVAGWSLNYAISANFGLAQLGAYGMANRFATFALVLPGLLTKNMLGILAVSAEAGEYQRLRGEIARYCGIAMSLSMASGLGAVAISFWPMGTLFDRYENARWFLVVLIFSSIFSALGSALGVVLVSLNMKRTWLLSDLALAAATLAALYLFMEMNFGVVILLCALPIGQAVGIGVRTFAYLRWRGGKKIPNVDKVTGPETDGVRCTSSRAVGHDRD